MVKAAALAPGDSFEPWYPQKARRARSSVKEGSYVMGHWRPTFKCRGSVGARWPSRSTLRCPLSTQGHSRSVLRASPEERASGSLFIRALAVECQFGRLSR